MKIRQARIEGDIAIIPLTGGYEAIVDAIDLRLLNDSSWHAGVVRKSSGAVCHVYARRSTPKGRTGQEVLMHRIIACPPEGLVVDHIDGDGLNNLRSNLRIATPAQNNHNQRKRVDNTSGVKGVHWHKRANKWKAQISFDGRVRHIGLFHDIELAAAAYAQESARLHGEFGRLE